MDRDTYERWSEHELRKLFRRAAAGEHVFPDELDDLNLPDRIRRATLEAIEQVRTTERYAGVEADRLSAELVEALPPHHETRAENERRRAAAGDAEAMANRQAAHDAAEDLADRIYRNAHGIT